MCNTLKVVKKHQALPLHHHIYFISFMVIIIYNGFVTIFMDMVILLVYLTTYGSLFFVPCACTFSSQKNINIRTTYHYHAHTCASECANMSWYIFTKFSALSIEIQSTSLCTYTLPLFTMKHWKYGPPFCNGSWWTHSPCVVCKGQGVVYRSIV